MAPGVCHLISPYPCARKRVHFVNLCNLFGYLGMKVITESVKQPWH